MSTMTPLPDDDPMMLAWRAFQETDDYKNALKWVQELGSITFSFNANGTRITAEHPYVEGSLWAPFIAGYEKGRTTRGKEISQVTDAFDVVKKAMKDDPELAWSWHSNIAMSFYDELGLVERSENRSVVCNRAAARFMAMCFDVDTSKEPHEQDKRGRDLVPTLNEVLAHIPASETTLIARLTSISGSAAFAPPEGMSHWWNEAAAVLQDEIGAPSAEWQRTVESIFSGRQPLPSEGTDENVEGIR